MFLQLMKLTFISDCANKQKFCYWAENNSRQLHERPLHSKRVTVWCAFSKLTVCGLYFFQERNHSVTVTFGKHGEMLQIFFEPKINNFHNQKLQFLQNGDTSHNKINGSSERNVSRTFGFPYVMTFNGHHARPISILNFFSLGLFEIWGLQTSTGIDCRNKPVVTLHVIENQKLSSTVYSEQRSSFKECNF